MRKTIGASESSSIYLFGICAGSLLSVFLSLAFSRTNASFDGMSVFNWVGYAVMQLAFFSTVAVYAKVRRIDEISVARIHKFTNWKQIVLLPFIGIATILAFLPLANLWSEFLALIGYHGAGVSMPNYSNAGVYLLSLLLMALIPALCEELFMRGNVFHGLSTRSIWFGILISALFFSLMHANPVQTVHQFGLGIVLALVLILSKSLWACVILHFFNNFVSITLTAYIPQVDVWYSKLGYYNWLVGGISVIVGVILLVFLLYFFYRFGKKRNDVFRVVGSIEYEDYSISVSADDQRRKSGAISDAFAFFKSLFTKNGWKRLSHVLERENGVLYLGKQQPMIGVWIALGLVIVYWLYAFIVGMI